MRGRVVILCLCVLIVLNGVKARPSASMDDPCLINPCLHGGICSTTPTTPSGSTTPTTPSGSTTPTTPSGSTTPTTPSGYTCNCSAIRYTGSDCELGYIRFSNNHISSYVGEASSTETVYADVDTELLLTSNITEVSLIPNPVTIRRHSKSATFQVKSNRRGRFLLIFGIAGHDADKFTTETDLTVTATDVFSRNPRKTPRFSLPKGCFYASLRTCNGVDILFLSTSPWYQLKSDSTVKYTFGVVFIEANSFSLPVSISGWEITQDTQSGQFSVGQVSDTRRASHGTIRNNNGSAVCVEIQITSRDIQNFLNAKSLLKTFLLNIRHKLPTYMIITPDSTPDLPLQRFMTSFITGLSVQQIPSCRGAPTFDNTLYSVFRFNYGIRITVMGQNVDIPAISGNEEYCVILDLCNDYGTTFMAMFPPSSRYLLTQIDAIKALSEKANIDIIPRGIGLSLKNRLNVHRTVTSLDFWNGDHMFSYAVTETATLWLAADITKSINTTKTFDYSFTGKNELFVRLPNLQKFMAGTFVGETNILLKHGCNADGSLGFKVFGKHLSIKMTNLALSNAYSYTSIGGLSRVRCGPKANPPGVFLKFGLEANAFRGIPILEDFEINIKSDNIFGFITFDSIDNMPGTYPSDNFHDILQKPKHTTARILRFVSNKIARVISKTSAELRNAVNNLETVTQRLHDAMGHIVIDDIITMNLSDFVDIVTGISSIFSDLKSTFLDLRDVARITFENDVSNLIRYLKSELTGVESLLKTLTDDLRKDLIEYFLQFKSFGMKLKFEFTLFGYKFPELEGEFVYSDNNIARCHTSDFVFNQLQDVESFRVYGGFIHYEQIFKYFKLGKGYGVELAFSTVNAAWVVGFHAKYLFLGLEAHGVVYVTTERLFARVDGKLFGAVAASVEAEIAWAGRKKREINGEFKLRVKVSFLSQKDGFNNSLGDAIRDIAKRLADNALKRLDQANATLTKAQSKLSGAQDWLEQKKEDVDTANAVFDAALFVLQEQINKTEDAKLPFLKAEEKLTRAQQDMDRLCKLKHCEYVCIPGLKGRWCKYGWIKYPCVHFTNCMLKTRNPLCRGFNTGCKILRGTKYTSLEGAKFLVTSPMVALDNAKDILSAAQLTVAAARKSLKAAKFAMAAAHKALEGVKRAIGLAKKALGALKELIKGALRAFDFIIKYGLQSIIDIRNCGFEAEISSNSWFEFTIGCEINIFSLGWNNLSVTINFKKLLTSIKNAATKIVNNAFTSLFRGRKRRYVLYTHDFTNSEGVFAHLCQKYTGIDKFLRESITSLFEVANATVSSLKQVDNRSLAGIRNRSVDPEEQDINITGLEEYNISRSRRRMIEMLNQTDYNDEILKQHELLNLIDSQNKETTDTIRQFNLLFLWKEAMENMTINSFSDYPAHCVSFPDCVLFSLEQLVIKHNLVDSSLAQISTRRCEALKNTYEKLLNTTSLNATQLLRVSEEMMSLLDTLRGDELFCADSPTIITPLLDKTITTGSTYSLNCVASNAYNLQFLWRKDDEVIANEIRSTYTIVNASTDDVGDYTCEVSNHIGYANTSAHISVGEIPAVTSVLPTELTLITGETIDVTCRASGIPQPNITWMSTISGMILQGPSIHIPSASPSDSGIYRCEGTNIHGTATSQIIAITIHDAIAACPESNITLGFVTADNVTENSTALITSTGSLRVNFQLGIETILYVMDTNVTVSNITVGSSSVRFIMRPHCSRLDILKCPKTRYQSRVDDIVAAVDLLTNNDPEIYLFEHSGRVYDINPAHVDYGDVTSDCPAGWVIMATHPFACVEDAVISLVAPPRQLLLDSITAITPLTVSWTPPLTGERFIAGYQIKLMDGETNLVPVTYVSETSHTFLAIQRHGVYTVYVRTVVGSHTSHWTTTRVMPKPGF